MNFLTISSSMSSSLHSPNTGAFSGKKKKDITVYYSIFPYYHQVFAVLLADGWVSLIQLQMMSDHGSKQEGGAYMYEREREGERERERERERSRERER